MEVILNKDKSSRKQGKVGATLVVALPTHPHLRPRPNTPLPSSLLSSSLVPSFLFLLSSFFLLLCDLCVLCGESPILPPIVIVLHVPRVLYSLVPSNSDGLFVWRGVAYQETIGSTTGSA